MKTKIGNQPATLPTYQCYKCKDMFINRYCLTPNKEGKLICDNCNEKPMNFQKKLDKPGDRLKRNHEQETICKYCGKDFDALKKEHEELKKRNGELVDALKKIINYSDKPFQHYWAACANSELEKINKLSNQALKNNSND